MLKSDLRGIETTSLSLLTNLALWLKSDLRGIETRTINNSNTGERSLKSDLRGIETIDHFGFDLER